MVWCCHQAMKLYIVGLVLALVATTWSSAIPKPDEHKNRAYDKDLSDQQHEREGDHNNGYDHDAFLGREDAKSFDQLTPEESKERLAIIVDKIDKDRDGYVTEKELQDWIHYVQRRYIVTDTERMWADHETEGDKLTWDSYKKRTYGFLDEDLPPDHPNHSYKEMMDRDKRRWAKADKDQDNTLTKDEFTDFLHPEEAEHMRDVVVMETLDDIDKDKDGFISLEEFIGDMWPNKEGEEEPEWVKSEREQFSTFRDKNNDKKLDQDEVKEWIMPPDYDHSLAESKHLIHESDVDRDGKLTKEEILESYDLFVGSQATDFGEALTRHDEF
ncbi:calumenin-like isoform X2 [Liolophura sinensis]|uniref:calumenin-like isoform X2 n=1 Tax=Liolophura sinensis TaxID=3198878 RepID=UPI00315871E7